MYTNISDKPAASNCLVDGGTNFLAHLDQNILNLVVLHPIIT